MINRRLFITLTAGLLSVSAAFPAMAGIWKNGARENTARWWYDNGDNTWASNGWKWIDGNQDGVSECYYFDTDGWLLTSTTTPDGYSVDANGAWVVDGVVQTKKTSTAQAQDEESWEDFQNSTSSSSKKSTSSTKSTKTLVRPTNATATASSSSDSATDSDSDSDYWFDDDSDSTGSSSSSSNSHATSAASGPAKEASSSSGDEKPEAPKKNSTLEPDSNYRQGSVTDEEIANNSSSDSDGN